MMDHWKVSQALWHYEGRQIYNLRLADDMDLIAESKDELAYHTSQVDVTTRRYDMLKD